MNNAIHILNASLCVTNRELSAMSTRVSKIFHVQTAVNSVQFILDNVYDNSRGQYNSTLLLRQLLEINTATGNNNIAVVDVDLFVPVLTFVFGEAQLGGSVAIVSTNRLDNQFYGLPADNDILHQRLEKEIIHELGHVYGLYHCRQFECVMRSSTYVEEIDLKRAAPCGDCQHVLDQHYSITNNKSNEHPIQSAM